MTGESSRNKACSLRCSTCGSPTGTDISDLHGVTPEEELKLLNCSTCYETYKLSIKMKEEHDKQNAERIRITEGGGNSISDLHDFAMDTRSEPVANPQGNSGQVATREESPVTNTEREEHRPQSSPIIIREVLEPNQGTGGTSQDNTVALVPDAGRENRDGEAHDIKESWKMAEKAKQIVEKEESRKNARTIFQPLPKVYKRPPMRKPRVSVESIVGVNSSSNEVSHLNGTVGRFWNGSTSVGCSDEPARQTGTINSVAFSESSQVPQISLSIRATGVSSAPEKEDRPQNENAKAQIQSLVKHCLSALPKDKKKLGTDGYKEVARVSTHTILAACGYEHNAALARLFAQPVCNHGKDMYMSDVLPSCCCGCFNGFVRQVVESVLRDRM